mmetsp:Transcript_28103/g.65288  ORF Transcript_28103/g.65288 Transcript_28103/m.65288 type:complete len:228 (-) Transcript_28103:303-986(-)
MWSLSSQPASAPTMCAEPPFAGVRLPSPAAPFRASASAAATWQPWHGDSTAAATADAVWSAPSCAAWSTLERRFRYAHARTSSAAASFFSYAQRGSWRRVGVDATGRWLAACGSHSLPEAALACALCALSGLHRSPKLECTSTGNPAMLHPPVAVSSHSARGRNEYLHVCSSAMTLASNEANQHPSGCQCAMEALEWSASLFPMTPNPMRNELSKTHRRPHARWRHP